MPRESTDQLYIELGYLTPEDYYTYTANAQSAQSVNSTVTAAVGVIKATTVAISSAFTPSITVYAIRNDESLLISSSDLTASANVIRDNNIAVSAVFDIATDASRVRNYGSSEDAAFAFSADNLRVRYDEAAVSAAFSLAAAGDVIAGGVIKDFEAALSAIASQSVTALRIQPGAADLNVAASTTSIIGAIKQFESTENSLFDSSVSCIIVTDSVASLSANSTIAISIDRIRDFDSALSVTADIECKGRVKANFVSGVFAATFTQTTLNNRIRNFDSAEYSLAETSISCFATLVGSINVNVTADLSAAGTANKVLASDLTSQFTESADVNRLRDVNASLQTTASLSATGYRIKQFASAENALFTPSITVNAIRFNVAGLNSSFAQSIIAQATKSAISNNSINVTQISLANKNAFAQSALTTTASITAELAKIYRISPTITDNESGNYLNNITFDSTTKKFGSHSLKIGALSSTAITAQSTIVYGNSEWISLGAAGYVWKSNDDGATWTRYATSGYAGTYVTRVRYLNNLYVAYSSDSVTTFYTSSDGITWTARTPGITNYNIDPNSVYYANGVWIIVAYRESTGIAYVYTSTNLSTWTQRTQIISISNISSNSLDVGNITSSGSTVKFVVTCSELISGSNYVRSYLLSSTNSTSWSSELSFVASSVSTYSRLNDIATDGSNNWIVNFYTFSSGSYTNEIYTKAGAGAWTKKTVSLTLPSNIFYFNKWYTKNSGGDYYSSTDLGTTWTLSYYGSGTFIPGNNKLALVNRPQFTLDYKFSITSDGTTWSVYNIPSQSNIPENIVYQTQDTRYAQWKTLDFWIYVVAPGANAIQYYMGQSDGYDPTKDQSWYAYSNCTTTSGQVGFFFDKTSTSALTGTHTLNAWHHVRVVRDGLNVALWIDGTRTSTRTLSSALPQTTGPFVIGGSNANLNVYLDEIYLTDDILTPTTTTSFSVPTNAWNNSLTTDLLLHFDNTLTDDNFAPNDLSAKFTIAAKLDKTAPGQANLQSTVSLSSTATVTKTITSNISALASELTVIARIRSEVANLDVQASLSSTGRVTRKTSSALSAQATLSATITKNIGPITAAIAANFVEVATSTLTAQGTADFQVVGSELVVSNITARDSAALATNTSLLAQVQSVKVISADFASTFTESATITKNIGPITAQLTAQASLTAQAIVRTANSINLTSNFTQSIAYRRYRPGSSFESAQAILAADPIKVIVADSAQTVAVSLTAEPKVTRTTTVSQTVIATEVTAVAVIGQGLINSTTTATLQATAQVITGNSALLNVTAAESATVRKTARITKDLASTFSLGIEYRVFKDFPIFMSAQANLSAQARSNRVDSANLNTTSNLAISGRVIRSAIIIDLGTFTQTAQIKRTRYGIANFTVQAAQVANTNKKTEAQAATAVQATLTAQGSLFRLDPDLTYVIPEETLEYTIEPDILEYKIEYEERTYLIEGP